jgi:hypothetical protein
MSENTVKVNRRAAHAVDRLAADDRQDLSQALSQLQGREPVDWPKDKVVRLPDPNPLYLLRVSDGLRAFLSCSPTNELELLDLVHADTLQPCSPMECNGIAHTEYIPGLELDRVLKAIDDLDQGKGTPWEDFLARLPE